MPDTFDMPASGSWEQRGGWVVNALARDFNMLDFKVAGLVGNLGFESRMFTAFHEGGVPEGRGGYGWAQWTASRRVAFFDWCQVQGLAPKSDRANYGYLCHELRTTHVSTLAALRNCPTIEAATWAVGEIFEHPDGTTPDYLPAYDRRLAYAKRSLAGARASWPTPEPIPAPDPGPAPVPKPVVKGNADIVFSWVQGMQHYLIDTGYLKSEADGIAGADFQDALARFQRDHKA